VGGCAVEDEHPEINPRDVQSTFSFWLFTSVEFGGNGKHNMSEVES
jgi:hypothetical protein